MKEVSIYTRTCRICREVGEQQSTRTVANYGVIVLDSDEVPLDMPCEDCGGLVISGLEPFAPGDDPELEAEGRTAAGSEWCTNP